VALCSLINIESVYLSDGEHQWIGDYRVYYWYRDEGVCPYVIIVALMALEKWLYDEIDATRPVNETLQILLERSRSVAFAGLLSAVARNNPALLQGPLKPLLAVPEFQCWEFWHSARPDAYSYLMMGWAGEIEPLKKLAHEWHTLPHRQTGLDQWGVWLFLNEPQMRPFFEQTRVRWIEQLESEQSNGQFKDFLERIIPQYDIANYGFQKHDNDGDIWVYEAPEEIRRKNEEVRKSIEETQLLHMFLIYCRQILDGGQPLPQERIEQFWDQLQRISTFISHADEGSRDVNVEDAVCGGAAVLLQFHRDWLKQSPDREAWCVAQLLKTIQNPRIDESPYVDIAFVTHKWDQFCAQVLPLLWVEDPDSPELRHCMAMLVTSHYYKTVEILFASAARLRSQLGQHFKQLQHFLLRWAMARWKWHRSRYDEQARLELDAWKNQEINAFTAKSLAADIPPWDTVAVKEPSQPTRQIKHRKGHLGIIRPPKRPRQPFGLDLMLIQHAYAWLPSLDRATSEDERAEWIGFWTQALDFFLWTLGDEVEGEEEIPDSVYEEDRWILDGVARLILELQRSEQPESFWQPILSLGAPGHRWVMTFLMAWFDNGLRAQPASDVFVREWRAMVEFAFASPKWQIESARRWFDLEDLWCSLLGFGRISFDLWAAAQKPVIRRLHDLYERWAQTHLRRPRCARAFINFLQTPAADEMRLNGLVWLDEAAKQGGDRFWDEQGLPDTLASLLDLCWTSHKARLRQQEATFDAFKTLLRKLADFQNPVALEIQHRVASANI
jgi:hypothetical protein